MKINGELVQSWRILYFHLKTCDKTVKVTDIDLGEDSDDRMISWYRQFIHNDITPDDFTKVDICNELIDKLLDIHKDP